MQNLRQGRRSLPWMLDGASLILITSLHLASLSKKRVAKVKTASLHWANSAQGSHTSDKDGKHTWFRPYGFPFFSEKEFKLNVRKSNMCYDLDTSLFSQLLAIFFSWHIWIQCACRVVNRFKSLHWNVLYSFLQVICEFSFQNTGCLIQEQFLTIVTDY